jgi:hypothetical protein
MAALTALALGLGAAAAGAGIFESVSGASKQQAGLDQQAAGYRIEQQAASQQAGIYKEEAASSVQFAGQQRDINIAAANASVTAATGSQTINKAIAAQQSNIQTYNQQAMELDARRQNLEQIRNDQRARSISLAAGVHSGGSGYVGGSSARAGAYGGISGGTNTNLSALQQALATGRNIYAANAAITGQNVNMFDLQTAYATQQAGFQTQNSNLQYSNAQANAGFQTRLADTQTLMAQGQGQVALGGGIASAGQSQQQLGSSLISSAGTIFTAGVDFNKLTAGMPSMSSLLGRGFAGPYV